MSEVLCEGDEIGQWAFDILQRKILHEATQNLKRFVASGYTMYGVS